MKTLLKSPRLLRNRPSFSKRVIIPPFIKGGLGGILILLMLTGLTACKIKLNIFSDDEDDQVVSASGNFNCTAAGGDCEQTYKPVGQCGSNPNCTEIDTEAQFTEVFAANPDVPVFAPAKPVYITSL